MKNTNNYNKELVITRLFNASREKVWQAWSDPEITKRWWGPKGFTSPACQIDFRIGGTYLMCMRSSEKMDFWNTGVYEEIVPLEKIVCTDCFADDKGNVVHATHYGMSPDFPLEMKVEVIFVEEDGKTKMTLRHIGLPSILVSDETSQGWNESFDKLAKSLK